MPALARGQENNSGIVNWFIRIQSILTDAYSVGFRIFDISGGTPGTQVFPTAPDYEEVVGSSGHSSVGSYFAYDTTNSQGWTPSLAEPLGTHRIEWRWKLNASSNYQASFEDFEVLVESAGSSADTYISVQDVRDAGLTNDPPTNETILASIETWQAFIERACRQWFVPRALTLEVDGTNSDALHFGVPIISVEYLRVNGEDTDLDTDLYEVYSEITYPDNRRNPRIKLVGTDRTSIFSGPSGNGQLKFRKGRKNQVVKGVFGYTEDDGSVPKLIKRALLKLVIEKLTNPVLTNPSVALPTPPPLVGVVLEEWTDSHRMKWGHAGGNTLPRAPGLSGITRDQEILDIIKLYKAPLGLATPR